jgi:hypothetical protein
MKKNLFLCCLLTLLLKVGNAGPSLALANPLLKGLPLNQNYWVVETNLKQRNYTIVRFYNSQHTLIYEEKLTNLYLNIRRTKHVKRLNLALMRVTTKWRAGITPKNEIAGLYQR